MSGLEFTEEAAHQLESLYLTIDVVSQRSETIKHLALRDGERVLDLGCGPVGSHPRPAASGQGCHARPSRCPEIVRVHTIPGKSAAPVSAVELPSDYSRRSGVPQTARAPKPSAVSSRHKRANVSRN